MEHTKACLWPSFWNCKQKNCSSTALSDAPLQVLDTNYNKVVFQFWISYDVLYKKKGPSDSLLQIYQSGNRHINYSACER